MGPGDIVELVVGIEELMDVGLAVWGVGRGVGEDEEALWFKEFVCEVEFFGEVLVVLIVVVKEDDVEEMVWGGEFVGGDGDIDEGSVGGVDGDLVALVEEVLNGVFGCGFVARR